MHLHLHSTNAETDIQWFSLKYIHALKLHTNVKVYAFGLIDTMGLFSIMRFNIISICGIPEKYYYEATRKYFFLFSSLKTYFKLCINFKES